MKKQVYIQCTDAFNDADLFIVDNQQLQKIPNIPFADIAKHVNLADSKQIVLMASPEIVLKEINVPKNVSSATLHKILPNMVEENIMSNIDHIHFAYSKLGKGNYALAWVEKQKLSEWLETLAQYGIKPEALYHASSGLTNGGSSWHVWIKDGIATIKTSPSMGFSMETPLLGTLLSAFYDEQSQSPEKIVISSPEATQKLMQDLAHFPQLKEKLEVDAPTTYPFSSPKRENVNLLHNHFAPIKREHKYKWVFIHASILSLLLMIFVTAQQVIYINYYRDLSQKQSTQIAAVYKSLYPNATQVSSPRLRMEQELKQIASQDPFFDILYHAGRIIRQNKNMTLQNINYSAQKMRMTITATNYADIETFIKELKAQKLNVVQNKTEQKENKVNAEFTISKGS